MKFPDNFPKELNMYFDNMDHIDIKAIHGGNTSLREFISRLLSYHPWWIAMLYQLRKILVSLLGLVDHEKPIISPITDFRVAFNRHSDIRIGSEIKKRPIPDLHHLTN